MGCLPPLNLSLLHLLVLHIKLKIIEKLINIHIPNLFPGHLCPVTHLVDQEQPTKAVKSLSFFSVSSCVFFHFSIISGFLVFFICLLQ